MSRLPPLAALAAPCGRVESSAERQPASRQQFGAILVTLRHLRAALSALHPSRQALRRSRMLCSIAHRRWRAWSVWLRRTIVRFCAPTALRRALLLIGGLCAVIDVSCVSGLSVKVTHTYTWYGTVYDKNALHCTPKVGHGAHKPRTVLSRATARRKRAAAQDTSSTADRRDSTTVVSRHPATQAQARRKRELALMGHGAALEATMPRGRATRGARASLARQARRAAAATVAAAAGRRPAAPACAGAPYHVGRARARALRPRTAIPAAAAGAPSAPSKPPTPPLTAPPSAHSAIAVRAVQGRCTCVREAFIAGHSRHVA